jgi:UDP-N-acetylmuramoyl-L-alanyl-D-glutamate--2,6-diaminopimelate ligase
VRTIGVTGTNGKTTTTWLVAAALRALGVGPIFSATTLGYRLDEARLDFSLDAAGFAAAVALGRSAGAAYFVLELTSRSLANGAARAWPCDVAVFTSFSRDHLDRHGTSEHYLASKAQLFTHLVPGGAAILNGCDPAGALLAEVLPAGTRRLVYGASTRGAATLPLDATITNVSFDEEGTRATLVGPSGTRAITTRAIGAIYAENAAAAYLAAIACGAPADVVGDAIARAMPPPGRFEIVARRPTVVVDFAHTPDALTRTLATARALARGRVILVFGAAGERDGGNRADLGRAALASDVTILTTDDPFGEDPAAIADAVREGLADHPCAIDEPDRRRAIGRALALAHVDDVVLLAGRGPETHQIVGAARVPFVDADVVREILAAHAPPLPFQR